MSPAVSSGEERGLLSRTAAGNRAYATCGAKKTFSFRNVLGFWKGLLLSIKKNGVIRKFETFSGSARPRQWVNEFQSSSCSLHLFHLKALIQILRYFYVTLCMHGHAGFPEDVIFSKAWFKRHAIVVANSINELRKSLLRLPTLSWSHTARQSLCCPTLLRLPTSSWSRTARQSLRYSTLLRLPTSSWSRAARQSQRHPTLLRLLSSGWNRAARQSLRHPTLRGC